MNANARRLRRIPLALLFLGCLLWSATPSSAQEEETVQKAPRRDSIVVKDSKFPNDNVAKLIFAGGQQLKGRGRGPECLALELCDAPVSEFMVGVQFGVWDGIDVRLASEYMACSQPWRKPPDLFFGDEDILAAGASISFTLEAVVPLVYTRFLLEPFVGVGASLLQGVDRDRSEETQEAYLTEASTDPLVTYGGTLSYRLTGRVDVQAHLRGATAFVGDRGYITPDGEPLEGNVGRLSWATALLGIAVRF